MEDYQKAFEILKDAFVSLDIMVYPNADGKFMLDADDSLNTVRDVLFQVQDGKSG